MSDKVYLFAIGIVGVVATAVELTFKFIDPSWLALGLGITGVVATALNEILALVKKYTNDKANKEEKK